MPEPLNSSNSSNPNTYIYDPSARERFQQVRQDVFHDKPFLRAFIRAVQKINPDIIAVYFPETYQLVFLYKWVIIYKIILNKENIEDISVDLHLKNIRQIILMLKNNLLPAKMINNIQQNTKSNFNKFKTGKVFEL